MSNLHQMYFAQAQNHALYKQGNPKANVWADECERLFKRDSLICDYYNHKMAGGKWNGMMTQKHIGYKSWNDDFEKDTCPELFRVTSKDGVIISENNGVVEIEAPYYSSKTDAAEAKWTEIPFMGKSVARCHPDAIHQKRKRSQPHLQVQDERSGTPRRIICY